MWNIENHCIYKLNIFDFENTYAMHQGKHYYKKTSPTTIDDLYVCLLVGSGYFYGTVKRYSLGYSYGIPLYT